MFSDGIDCINVYSRGKTPIGRILSNFAHTPFKGNGLQFESVEAWWYWFTTGKKHDNLCSFWGFRAKKEGKQYPRVFEVTPDILREVYKLKVACNPQIKEMLKESHLPFTHYYEYGSKIVETDWQWTGELWNEIREEAKNDCIE